MRYLITTKDQGIGYSHEQEAEFNSIYSKLLPVDKQLPAVNLFSDAGFANCLRTMRST